MRGVQARPRPFTSFAPSLLGPGWILHRRLHGRSPELVRRKGKVAKNMHWRPEEDAGSDFAELCALRQTSESPLNDSCAEFRGLTVVVGWVTNRQNLRGGRLRLHLPPSREQCPVEAVLRRQPSASPDSGLGLRFQAADNATAGWMERAGWPSTSSRIGGSPLALHFLYTPPSSPTFLPHIDPHDDSRGRSKLLRVSSDAGVGSATATLRR
ncbi:hypothetical protein IWX90DRAFT_90874 [Phyllosticta citrichinensis]|uniref:Uncharacterized protein n=1 Tax=Phyllosticta citrichinensis TaxID=1130410 RepID=A0ABR1XF61_9PEZI